jgi:long-subunit fatty acid transport protein
MIRCLFAASILIASPAWAAGFFRPGIGVGNLGAGGTGVASGSPGYGAWYNPAMLGLTKGSAELTFDWTGMDEQFTFKRNRDSLLPPERQQQDDDAGGYYSSLLADNCCYGEPTGGEVDKADMRQIPFVGIAFPIRDDLVLGVAMFGPHGPRRNMRPEGSQRYAVVATDITLAIMQASLAYRQKRWGVGLGLTNFWLNVEQTFTLSGDLTGTEDPNFDAWAKVAVEDRYVPVINVGFWATPLPGLRIGASFLRPVAETCKGSGDARVCGHVYAEGSITPELAPGLAALAEVSSNDGGALVMRFPDMMRFGLSQRVGSSVEVSVDGFYESWGSMGDLTFVPDNVAFTAIGQEIKLENIVFPRRWVDTYGARFGTRWDLPKAWAKIPVQMRVGAQWESSATPLAEIDPGALDWEKFGLTVGCGVEVIKGLHVDAYFLRLLDADIEVTNSNMRTANIMHAAEIEAGRVGLETVAGNGSYNVSHQRFGFGLRYALGVN